MQLKKAGGRLVGSVSAHLESSRYNEFELAFGAALELPPEDVRAGARGESSGERRSASPPMIQRRRVRIGRATPQAIRVHDKPLQRSATLVVDPCDWLRGSASQAALAFANEPESASTHSPAGAREQPDWERDVHSWALAKRTKRRRRRRTASRRYVNHAGSVGTTAQMVMFLVPALLLLCGLVLLATSGGEQPVGPTTAQSQPISPQAGSTTRLATTRR